MATAARKPKPKGFAGMDPERVREIASLGGRAAHNLGRAHQFTPDEARAAGKKSWDARKLRAKQLRLPV